MRIAARATITTQSAPESQKPRKSGVRLKRGTEESNLALRFWRPPCYRYTSPPGAEIVGPGDARARMSGPGLAPQADPRTAKPAPEPAASSAYAEPRG
jgi:hypothetical protein